MVVRGVLYVRREVGVRPQVFFFMNQFPGNPEYPLGPLQIFTKICGDIRNFVFIASVNDTGKLYTGVNDTGYKLLPVSLLPEINYCQCR